MHEFDRSAEETLAWVAEKEAALQLPRALHQLRALRADLRAIRDQHETLAQEAERSVHSTVTINITWHFRLLGWSLTVLLITDITSTQVQSNKFSWASNLIDTLWFFPGILIEIGILLSTKFALWLTY